MKTPTNEQSEEHDLYSDHMPVLATIALSSGPLTERLRTKTRIIKNYNTKIDRASTKQGIADLAKYEASTKTKEEEGSHYKSLH